MRKFVVAAFAVLALSAAAYAADWVSLKDPLGAFFIDVPSDMTVKNTTVKAQTGDDIPVVEYLVDRGSSAMLLMVGDLTNRAVDGQAAADLAVKGIQSGNRTVLTNEVETLDGHVGRAITVTDTTGNQFTDRIFFVEGRLYQVITVVPKSPTQDQIDEVSRFNRSFHFLH